MPFISYSVNPRIMLRHDAEIVFTKITNFLYYICRRVITPARGIKEKSMEKVLQYIWQHRLWNSPKLSTVDGRALRVLDQGKLNNDAGPDFFNALIRIDEETWGGDVEIHVKASDWYRHGHDTDRAYASVILHVVEKDDREVTTPGTDRVIPQLRLSCDNDFKEYCRKLLGNALNDLPCRQGLQEMAHVTVADWMTALAFERLIDKSERITELLGHTTANWEEVAYITLARALGTGVNGQPFQLLALNAPLRISSRHSDNLTALESLLFGQAGLLKESHPDNAYYLTLQREYAFLANKYALKAPQGLNWKMARMRPANFPHRRIALLAGFLEGGFKMMSRLTEAETLDEVREVFHRELTGYWTSHFNFAGEESQPGTSLSQATVDSLVINVAVPLIYTYGFRQLTGRKAEMFREKAVEWLEQMKPERNFITAMFSEAGIMCRNAFMSQAMIQLRRKYCENRKCIYCRFGHRLMASKVHFI